MITDDRLKELVQETVAIIKYSGVTIQGQETLLATLLQFKISQEVALTTKTQLRGNS